MNYLYVALAIIITLVVLKFILKLSVKIFSTFIIIIAVVITAFVAVVQPKMHKEFNFNVIKKVLNFNSDGSVSIKETTTINEVKRK